MTIHSPVPLDTRHQLELFDCGEPILNDWLIVHARQAQASGSAKTFIVTDDDRVIGYYSLTVGQINALEAPERARKGMGRYPLPVVILTRLAVSREYHGRGIGRGLLQDAISANPGHCRAGRGPGHVDPSTARRSRFLRTLRFHSFPPERESTPAAAEGSEKVTYVILFQLM